jgi:dTDP-4-amino-4,6-dideoxygalactose transaminase
MTTEMPERLAVSGVLFGSKIGENVISHDVSGQSTKSAAVVGWAGGDPLFRLLINLLHPQRCWPHDYDERVRTSDGECPRMIPFNKPGLSGGELNNVAEAVSNGHAASGGPFTKQCSDFLIDVHGSVDALVTTSCTDALEMSAMLLDLGPSDVVILPSFTFTSTATAFARQGAKLRFCDIDPVTLGLDPAHVAASMTPEVRAIVTVHYAGVPSNIDALVALADLHGIPLIEDNAHGFFASHNGQPLGTFGRMSTLSFHETKNFHCGEGGALILNEERDVDRAHVLLDKGTNRQQFLQGTVDKYTWQGHGSSFGLSDLLAAYLASQFEHADKIRAQRRAVATLYAELLEPKAEDLGLRLISVPESATPADHMFFVILPDAAKRAQVISAMRDQDVNPAFHYVPLHSAPGAAKLVDSYQDCPVTDDVSARLLRLPFYNALSDDEIRTVVDALEIAIIQSGDV